MRPCSNPTRIVATHRGLPLVDLGHPVRMYAVLAASTLSAKPGVNTCFFYGDAAWVTCVGDTPGAILSVESER